MNMKHHARVTVIAHAGSQVVELCVEGDHTPAFENRVMEAMEDVVERLGHIRRDRSVKKRLRKSNRSA